MDRRLLRYYDRELGHLRGMAQEFAREFPKIAGRLALDGAGQPECPDPYVERLLEGFAFLAARVHLKLDAEFPRFTQSLFETVFPHYLAPTPSMAVVRMNPDYAEAGLAQGIRVPRGTIMRSSAVGDQAPCEYRTSQEVRLYPLQIAEARYYGRDASTLDLPHEAVGATRGENGMIQSPARAAVRIRLQATAGLSIGKLSLDELSLYLTGSDMTSTRLHEQLLSRARAVVVRPVPAGGVKPRWSVALPGTCVRRQGFEQNEAMLPFDARSFQGYRLLQEYFSFPQRFLFVKLAGLQEAIRRVETPQVDIIVVLREEHPLLENAVSAENFALHCTPVANVFPMRADRINVTDRASEFQVIPDRTRPLDFEVYRVLGVEGYGSGGDEDTRFSPFYSASDVSESGRGDGAYFAVNRVPRALTEREQRMGRRSSYLGSDVYVALVDAKAAPFSPELRQLGVETLCTNRDLPLQMPVGKGDTDFSIDAGLPIKSTRVVAGPTPPRPSYAEGEFAWRLISHLSLNYLSIVGETAEGSAGVAALRDIMKLYGVTSDPAIRKQIGGLRSVSSRPVTRRVATAGPIAFARGLEVTIGVDESAFEGTGAFILGAVLEEFLARHVSLNSFTETVLRSEERGEVMRWPARVGQRPLV
jgi:type VI secretion system protein ImpG